MASITKETVGLLHEKLNLKLEKSDYLPGFEKSLKEYSKKANIPGFRKGMVPTGMIKKMHGASIFTDEILRTVDKSLSNFLETEKLNIFAQPLPVDLNLTQLDMNNPTDYNFYFEIGMKGDVALPDFAKGNFTRYKITVTEVMIDEEVARLQNRYGTMSEPETVTSDENVLNVTFIETDETGTEIEGGIRKENSLLVKYFVADFRNKWMGRKKDDSETIQLKTAFDEKEREWILGDLGLNKEDNTAADKYFKVVIAKLGLLIKKELNEEFFKQLYPELDVLTEIDFRNKTKDNIQLQWDNQSTSQLQHTAYHELLDKTQIEFPEIFLKKWLKSQNENSEKEKVVKTDEEIEKEFPSFQSQLKWTLITEKIVKENNIQVQPEELRNFASQQLFSYMGGMGMMDENQSWVKDYIDKMMKDRKFVEDAYHRIQGQKIVEWAATQMTTTAVAISMEDFTKMQEVHQHLHH